MLDRLSGASFHKKALAVVVGLAVVSGIAGTAAALTLTSLETQNITLFGSQSDDSNFNIQSYDTKVKGKQKVDVDLTVHNTDTSNAHRANVTVQVLNATDAVLAEATKDTGSVAADTSLDMTFNFQDTNLAETYDETFIVVDDSS